MLSLILAVTVWLGLHIPAVAEKPQQSEKPTKMHSNKSFWSSLRIIDAHAHIGKFEGYDLSAPTLLENVRSKGIHLALVSNIDGAELPSTTRNLSELKANEAMSDVVVKNKKVLRGLVWARPEEGSKITIGRFLDKTFFGTKEKIFVGVKFHPDMNHYSADAPKLDPYLEICAKYGVPAVFHCGGPRANSSPAKIYALAKRHPKVPIVLYHMGFGTNHEAAITTVEESLRQKDANLYLETSQADPQKVVEAIKRVGAERVLFGTDASYFGKHHYEEYKPLISLLQANLSPTELSLVLHGNAERIFQLTKN